MRDSRGNPGLDSRGKQPQDEWVRSEQHHDLSSLGYDPVHHALVYRDRCDGLDENRVLDEIGHLGGARNRRLLEVAKELVVCADIARA